MLVQTLGEGRRSEGTTKRTSKRARVGAARWRKGEYDVQRKHEAALELRLRWEHRLRPNGRVDEEVVRTSGTRGKLQVRLAIEEGWVCDTAYRWNGRLTCRCEYLGSCMIARPGRPKDTVSANFTMKKQRAVPFET